MNEILQLDTTKFAQFQIAAKTFEGGYWQIGGNLGLRVYPQKKPHFVARVLCDYLLGWEWKE